MKVKTPKVQNRKVAPWKARDFVRTIALYVLNFILVAGWFLLTVYLNGKIAGMMDFLSYFKENGAQFAYLTFILFLILFVLYLFFYFEFRNFLKQAKNAFLVFAIIDATLICSYFTGVVWDVYARPIALGALLAVLLVGRKQAVVLNFVICLLLFLSDTFTNAAFAGYENANYSSLVVGFTAGSIGIYLVSHVRSRIMVFFSGFVIAIPVFLCMGFLEEEGFLAADLTGMLNSVGYGLTSGLLSVILFMAILPLYEAMFNIVTDYRLREITDHRSPLVKRLIDEAPGTFSHSLLVSNLAEACAIAIGENSALARACAYYHDMGKLKQPEYFAENQTDFNPHDELSPELSVDIIRSHARDGYEIIKKYRLPAILADVARQHHGTMPIRYFYAKASKFSDRELDLSEYSYAGPKPQTKIAAIIMLCDASEAVVRTLPERDAERVDAAVKGVIQERMEHEQFTECDVTMRDLEIIRHSIVAGLTGIYHGRVAYPKLRAKDEDEEDGNA